MKGAMTAAAMHRQYDEGVSAFRQHIANPAMRQKFNQDVDEFMRQCALGVWQADGGNVSPQHVEYYNGILRPLLGAGHRCGRVSRLPAPGVFPADAGV